MIAFPQLMPGQVVIPSLLAPLRMGPALKKCAPYIPAWTGSARTMNRDHQDLRKVEPQIVHLHLQTLQLRRESNQGVLVVLYGLSDS